MPKFKKGQKAVCIARNPDWVYTYPLVRTYLWGLIKITTRKAVGPKFNEIVTVDGYTHNGQYLFLQEYNIIINDCRLAWAEISFEPLVDDAVLEEELSSIEISN